MKDRERCGRAGPRARHPRRHQRSKPGELVALLGKGHEDYQIIGAEKIPWSDRRAAEEGLAQWRPR
jgi:hypothetical protein